VKILLKGGGRLQEVVALLSPFIGHSLTGQRRSVVKRKRDGWEERGERGRGGGRRGHKPDPK